MSSRCLARFILVSFVALFLVSNLAEAGPGGRKMMMEYRRAVNKVRNDPVQAIPIHLEYAIKATEAARDEQNPNYMGFTGGAENVQYLTEARTALDKLIADRGDSDADVVRLTTLYDETWNKVAALCSAFNENKLEAERAPDDVYSGSDRKNLEAMVLENWQELYPDDTILDIRFHMADWDRDKGRKWHDIDQAWHEFDKSVLAVSMIIQSTDSVATIYPAYVNKDNLAGGKLTIGVETKGDGYVHREVLIKNITVTD